MTSGTGGTIKNATVCGSAKDYYEIGSNANYLEGAVTANSASSSITSVTLGGSTNNGTNPGVQVVVYSNKYPFDATSVTGYETFTAVNSATTTWTTYAMASIPSGTKSFRLYRKVSYDSSTGAIGSGTSYGDGVTMRLAYVAYTVTEPETTGISSSSKSSLKTYSQNGELVIEGAEAGAGVQVYNLTGSLVKSFSTSGSNAVSLAKGLYLVKVGGKTSKVLVK